MSVSIISPDEWQVEKWKNGAGITNELSSEKDEYGKLWSLSMGKIGQNYSFPATKNMNSQVMLLQGKGFKLTSDNKEYIVTQKYEPYACADSGITLCDLLDGPICDFNLMTRKSSIQPVVKVLQLTSAIEHQFTLTNKQLIYIADGSIMVDLNQEKYSLNEQQLLRINNENGKIRLTSITDNATLVLINLIKK